VDEKIKKGISKPHINEPNAVVFFRSQAPEKQTEENNDDGDEQVNGCIR